MSDLDERILSWFLRRIKNNSSGKILTSSVMAKLRSDVINDPVAIRKAIVRLRENGHLNFTSDDRGQPVSSYIKVSRVILNTPDYALKWFEVLNASALDQGDKEVLLSLAEAVFDFSLNDMQYLLEGLIKLRSNPSEYGKPSYLVSAEYLLGSSKLLCNLPRKALRNFGINTSQFVSHPLYVIVAGCELPETVVLIENPAAFELAITTSAISSCAFIVTFGFGLSKTHEDYGNQLVALVENRFANAITLRREGATCPEARDLLCHSNITFWGDLDLAGIEIYQRLKKVIPQLQLSKLYKPMIASIKNPSKSHPYVKIVGKERQPLMPKAQITTTVAAISRLTKLCEKKGVDQEQLSSNEIAKYAHLGLDIEDLS